MKKSVASLALSASLLSGGVAGAALFTPALAGAQESAEPAQNEDQRAKASENLAEALTPLVEDGTLTQSQADAVVETMLDARQENRDARKEQRQERRGNRLEALADATGIGADVWSDGFKNGATPAETAEANGLSSDELVDILVAQAEARLDDAVESGRIDADRADARRENIRESVTSRVDGERPEGRRGRGRGPGPGRGFAGDHATDEAPDA